ncbi:MAG: TatD family hydrolase [Spirochaetia bacterium]|nr:TatD family hydrolase [Spirochaetia bacterium]
MLDAHCHYFPASDDDILVLYNSVTPDDWAKIPLQNNIIPFYGIHPWYADNKKYDVSELERFISSMDKKNGRFGLGETGIDRAGRNPPEDSQVEFFRKHLELAERFGLPVSVHCVRAWGILNEILQDVNPDIPILMHYYSGSWETARSLLRRNTWFSFQLEALDAGSKSAEIFRKIPVDRLFLETDSMVSVSDRLKNLYTMAAGEKGTSAGVLETIIKNNLETFFQFFI